MTDLLIVKKNNPQASMLLCVTMLLGVFAFSSSPSVFVSNKTSSQRTEVVVNLSYRRKRIAFYKNRRIFSTVLQPYSLLPRGVFQVKIILKLFDCFVRSKLDTFGKQFNSFKRQITFFAVHHRSSDNDPDSIYIHARG